MVLCDYRLVKVDSVGLIGFLCAGGRYLQFAMLLSCNLYILSIYTLNMMLCLN